MIASALAAALLLGGLAARAAEADGGPAARPSLIVNGDFKGLDAPGRPAGWRLAETGVKVVTEGDTATLALKTTEPSSTSATQELVLDPSWGLLRFSYHVRVKAIAPGRESWHDARIALTFLGPDDKVNHLVAGYWQRPTDGWVAVEQDVPIPAGAATVKISPAIFEALGEWELRGLRVELLAKRGEGIDSRVPTGQSVTWGQEPVEELGPRRAVVCLNGLWRFQPALGPAVASPQSTGWGWVRVPGSWRAWGAFEGVTRASGPSWDGFDGENPAAWYERDLTVPAPWSGRAIFLDLQRVSTDAAVFIDGREVGRLAWPGGEIDLTAAVQPGQTHRLRLKVWQPRADGLVLCRLARQRVQLRRAVAVGPGRAGPAGVR